MMNNFSGSGRVATVPHVGRTSTNNDFVKFIVEVARPRGKDGKQGSDRINVGAWGAICKTAQYIEQGDYIEFTGPITTRNYQDDGGQWVNQWEVSLKTVEIKAKTNGINQQRQSYQAQNAAPNSGISAAPVAVPMSPPPVVPLPATPPPPSDDAIPFDIYGYGGY